MPCESNIDTQCDKKILDTLSLDCEAMEKEGIKYFIKRDFNAHIGSPAESSLGIKGNHPKIGRNGSHLLTWMSQHGKTTLNSQPYAKGHLPTKAMMGAGSPL